MNNSYRECEKFIQAIGIIHIAKNSEMFDNKELQSSDFIPEQLPKKNYINIITEVIRKQVQKMIMNLDIKFSKQ